jgi:hypothetical protein
MQPTLNGIDRDTELVGRLGGGEFVNIAQDEGVPYFKLV